jgi:hypothetical protein
MPTMAFRSRDVVLGVFARERGRVRGLVFRVAAVAAHAVVGPQLLTHRRIELRADRVVGRQVAAGAGRPQALVLQNRPQCLSRGVVEQSVGTLGVVFGGVRGTGEVPARLREQTVGVLAAGRDLL